MAQKCVHKGCGKTFTDPEEPCTYHPGPPIFHEGQKGWRCCNPRVLTFDEFLVIPPCTTGKHSTIDDTPQEPPKPQVTLPELNSQTAEPAVPRIPNPPSIVTHPTAPPAPPPQSESDDPSLSIPAGVSCRRKGCNASYNENKSRAGEKCVHHPGVPVFHEGSKGWTCCKRRVLEFDEFMKIEGCKIKDRHLFIGKGKKSEVEKLEIIRYDFYQTATTVIASIYLKKIDKDKSKITFTSPTTIDLDLQTSDNKHYAAQYPLFGDIVPEKSSFKIMGTKLELTLSKADGIGWSTLKSTDPSTGEIIQSGRAGRV